MELSRSDFQILNVLKEHQCTNYQESMTLQEIIPELPFSRVTAYKRLKNLCDMGYTAKGCQAEQADTYYILEKGIRVADIQEQYGESDVLTSLSNYASGGLEEANDILSEYQDLYNQAKQAELFSDKQQYSGKTALEWLNKYEDAVNKYNDAISNGNADEIADAKQYYDDINKSVQVLMNTDASKYSSQFKEIGDQLNTAAIKANEFNQALSGEGENGFQKHLQSVAEEIKKLNMDDADFNELDELTKQLNDGVEAGTIVENSQEWLDMQTKIKEAQNAVSDYDTQIEELKQSQIGVYYEEQFDRAAEKVDRFRDKLDGLKSLISDDMKIDKNTGLLTESGALSITLDVDDINASTENLKTYIKERQQIINDYNAGKFGEDEYNQKLKDVDANIKSTTANIYSSRNSILELVKSQSQAELDVLNKVIDKRKEALSAKKNYYDYDKTLKNKTKDIEVLERQIAALEGSTSAEDKARKAKLQEQLQSAKDDLNDTIVDHAYSMQTDSLDKLSTDLSEDLDTWINKISSNMEDMTNAINGAISNAGLSTASTINAISSILRHYGLSDSEISQSGLTDIKGYASGTDYVNKSGMYRVNENGMESVLSRKYGTLTFLNQGDKVFDANFTKGLLDNATIATQKNMPDYAGMAKAIEKNIQNIQNMSGNTYVNNFYIDGAQDTDSILREIDRHLDRKIKAHDKKQVRDFRSLR